MRRLYRALLLLYPPAFRRRYGTELMQAYDGERAEARQAGVRGALRLWRVLLLDLLTTAARQRRRAISHFVFDHTGGGAPRPPHRSRRGFMETLLQDVRYAARQLTRKPGFTAVALLSLVLGIGGNAAIFGLLDGYVFNPFPYPEPDRLVAIGATFPKVSSQTTYVEVLSPAEYEDVRAVRSFEHVAAFDLGNRNVAGGDVPERVFTAFLLDDLFPVMGMRPHLGRGFTREELAPRGPRVAIISYRLWQSRFAADPKILDRTIRIGGASASIVGVMPPGLVLIGTDMWLPWGADPARVPRNARQFTILARLAPGVSREEANAELATVAARTAQAHAAELKEYDGWRLTATPWAAALMQDLRPAAAVLLVAVALVLLIACANLTSLMLARASTRHRELAVRLALGAGRWRIARQLVTESLLLSIAGAAGGVLLAYVALQSAGALIPAQFEALGLEARITTRVLAWTAAAALVTGLLVAVLPALQASGTDPHESLKSEGRAGASRRGARVRHVLVVAEVALSVVLLLGAGLLMRSFLNLQRLDLGYDPRGVLTMRLTLPMEKYTPEAVTAFFEDLASRVEQLPEVTSAAAASQFPPGAISNVQVEVEGMTGSGTTLPSANLTVASRAYFRTIGVPLVRGRTFDTTDTPSAPPRVVVNRAFVERYLDGRDPLATRIRGIGPGGPGPWSEIVGVVGDARNSGLTAPVRPEVFNPMEGRGGWNQLFLLVRTDGDPHALLPAVRKVIVGLDPEQPVYAIRTMEEAIAAASFQQRVSAVLLGMFAAVALALAAIGIYGVMSYSVGARTQEIGVRMAVGAERSDVLRLVLGQVARLTGIGAAIGVALLLVASRPLAALLYGVEPSDPLTIAVVTLTLAAIALTAGWIPARRASRINPIEALRYE